MRRLGSGVADVPTPPARVFLVDDHEVVPQGVCDLINDKPDMKVVGQASSTEQVPARGPALRPDVAVLDVRLPDANRVAVYRDSPV